MKNLVEIKDRVEELLYDNGMYVVDDWEKVEIDEERVECYRYEDVFVILFFDYGDSLGEIEVVENFDDIKKCIREEGK